KPLCGRRAGLLPATRTSACTSGSRPHRGSNRRSAPSRMVDRHSSDTRSYNRLMALNYRELDGGGTEGRIQALKQLHERASLGGGLEAINKQHERRKLTARERL